MFKCKEDFDERVQRFDAAKGPALAVLFGPRPRAAPSRRGSSGGVEQGGRGPHWKRVRCRRHGLRRLAGVTELESGWRSLAGVSAVETVSESLSQRFTTSQKFLA